jgi:hypothetical protein
MNEVAEIRPMKSVTSKHRDDLNVRVTRLSDELARVNVKLLAEVEMRVQAENDLRAKEAVFEKAQRLVCVGDWRWYADRRLTCWSHQVYRILGLQSIADGGSYQKYLAAVHPRDRLSVSRAFGTCCASPVQVSSDIG